jgi:hypothetical protein
MTPLVPDAAIAILVPASDSPDAAKTIRLPSNKDWRDHGDMIIPSTDAISITDSTKSIVLTFSMFYGRKALFFGSSKGSNFMIVGTDIAKRHFMLHLHPHTGTLQITNISSQPLFVRSSFGDIIETIQYKAMDMRQPGRTILGSENWYRG